MALENTSSSLTAFERFEREYLSHGFQSQRQYPNEELCRFLGRNFGLGKKSRDPAPKILELGCGSGGNLWMLAKEGFETHGIDASDTALTEAERVLRERWGVRATLQRAYFWELPYNANTFDAAVDIVSLEHQTVAEHEKSLAEVFRVLKTGGRFFSYHLGEASYSFQHAQAEKLDYYTVSEIKNPKAPFHGAGATCFISVEEYDRILRQVGFSTIVIERVVKTYGGRELEIEYLSVDAVKSA